MLRILLLLIAMKDIYALEVDEVLTSRLLKVSDSKKTVLVNRGSEDGLNERDHGKFFITKGVIARGILEKVSPTRSIWSLYRIVRSDELFPNKLLNLKITPSVDLTKDPTKAINTPQVETLPSSGTIQNEINFEDQQDLEALRDSGAVIESKSFENVSTNQSRSERTWETWSLLHLNSMSADVSYGQGGSSSSELSALDFSFGIEKYFQTQSFFKNISLSALVHIFKLSNTSISGVIQSTNVFEYGLGASYHFLSAPLAYGRFIGFGNVNFGIGDAKDSVNQEAASVTYSGSSNFFSLGLGFKYYLQSGFGARAILDYYRRSEIYDFSDSESDTKTVSGPRLLVGMSYRW